jgi:iron complex transport system permease protein
LPSSGLLLVAAVALHLLVARHGANSWIALRALFGAGDAIDVYVVQQIRLPRLLVALTGGAALALAGAVLQAAFRNPLASPDIVGTAAGAAFGGAIAITQKWAAISVLAVPLASLAGAGLITWLVFALAAVGGRYTIAGLLLAGIALNTLAGALTSFVVTFTFDNYSASSDVLFWLMGGLDARTWHHAAITAGGCAVFGAFAIAGERHLDLLTLRDETAQGLGLDVRRARRGAIALACGLVATTVSSTGGIALVGLLVPHAARLLVGPRHRTLLPASALLGGLLLVLGDSLCRLSPPDANLRLGVVTSVLGAPYFLFLLARHRRGEVLS